MNYRTQQINEMKKVILKFNCSEEKKLQKIQISQTLLERGTDILTKKTMREDEKQFL